MLQEQFYITITWYSASQDQYVHPSSLQTSHYPLPIHKEADKDVKGTNKLDVDDLCTVNFAKFLVLAATFKG